MTVRIFVAFDADHDQDLFDRMVASSRRQETFEISGRSQNSAMPEPWQQRTQGQVAAADQVVVVCGEHTDKSERVAIELRIAQEQGKPVILLWSRRESMCKKPLGARPADSMYSWTDDALRERLIANKRKAHAARVPQRLKRDPRFRKPRAEPGGGL